MTPITVVLADDQHLIRAGLAMLLSAQKDIEVVGEVSHGRAAVDMAEALVPNVVLMDIRMPVMSGVEATRRIMQGNEARPDRPVRVLALTAFDDDESLYGVLRAGASGFLMKHAAPHDLPTAIRSVGRGNSWLDPRIAGRVISELRAGTGLSDGPPPQLASLTPREIEVLKLVGAGMSNAEIAEHLVLSEATVKTHVSKILFRTGSRDRAQAVALAYRSGLMPN